MDIIIILLLIFLILAIILRDIFNPPTYTRFALPLPQPPGQPPLPPFIYFDIDTRFTPAEVSRIKTIIADVLNQWSIHHTQKWNGGLNNGVSSWAACAQTYAFNRLKPIWQVTPVPNGLTALNEAMDLFTQRFIENGFGGIVAKIDYHIPTPITSSTIRGQTAFRRNNVPLSITINPTQIDRIDIPTPALEGSLVHAWLHRVGYTHPFNTYTTYFSGEAAMCYMRGYFPKNPAVPDAVFTQLFD
ncbi:hypothetical protein [Priestia megaterium]|uniref:hypothetical protein n=1 Tax=Priestia megaterium TaxID=1404 RepID=UPI0021D663DA|nr:hypothetical protein [Priestia megaterium]MCU7767015.1 hypothetical protein [Priestia megaterium]